MRDIINMEFAAHRVKARAVAYVDAPQCWTFIAKMAFGGRVEQVERLAATLAEKTGALSCRVDRSPQGLLIQLAKPPSERAFVTTGSLAGLLKRQQFLLRASLIPVGVTPTGGLAWVDLADANTPHVAVFGLTGSGKTTLMRWMAWWLSLSKQRCLVLASPKAEDYVEFSQTASALHPPVQDADTFARLLTWLESELERRSANPTERQPLVIVIDEVSVWISKVERTDAVLEAISTNGRALNMHLVLGSQRADEASVGRAAFNMTCRVVGKIGSGVFKFGTAGVAGADLESLQGKGDVLMVTPAMQRFQVPILGESDWQRLAGQPGEIAFPDAKPVERKPLAAARATDIDESDVLAAFRAGVSRRQVMADFRIGHDRAKRLEQLARPEKGTAT